MQDAYTNLRQELDREAADTGSRALELFVPSIRKESESLRIIPSAGSQILLPEFLSRNSPQALRTLGELQYHNTGQPRQLQYFLLGAVSTAILVSDEAIEQFATLISGMAEKVGQAEVYPAISERHATDYFNTFSAVLRNGETANREQLLAYDYGVFWALGHIQNVDLETATPNRPYNKGTRIADWVSTVLLHRAIQAYLEDV